MNWWKRFTTWLGISNPGQRKEQVETWIEANAALINGLHDEQATTKDARGGFRQLRRQDKSLTALPMGTEFQVDVYEAPVDHATKSTRFGYTMTFTVTEADASVWTLTLEPGSEDRIEWKETLKEIDRGNSI